MLQSCPAIRVFSSENLERGLDSAAKSFCTQEVCIDKNGVGTYIAIRIIVIILSHCFLAVVITILVAFGY